MYPNRRVVAARAPSFQKGAAGSGRVRGPRTHWVPPAPGIQEATSWPGNVKDNSRRGTDPWFADPWIMKHVFFVFVCGVPACERPPLQKKEVSLYIKDQIHHPRIGKPRIPPPQRRHMKILRFGHNTCVCVCVCFLCFKGSEINFGNARAVFGLPRAGASPGRNREAPLRPGGAPAPGRPKQCQQRARDDLQAVNACYSWKNPHVVGTNEGRSQGHILTYVALFFCVCVFAGAPHARRPQKRRKTKHMSKHM